MRLTTGPSKPTNRLPPQGFTLTELLIVAVVGGLMIAATAQVIVSHMRMSANQLLVQRLRSDWDRLSFFLATEVGEGDQLSTGATLTGCGSTATGSTSLLSVRIPMTDYTATASATVPTRTVHYYLNGTGTTQELRRCGPAILSDGKLNAVSTSALVDSVLIRGIPLAVAVSNQTSVTVTPTTTISGSVEPFTLRTKVQAI